MIISLYNYYTIILLKNKNLRKRGGIVFLNALNSLSTPLFNFFLAALIISKLSLGFWGEFVSLTLIVNLSSMLLSWGNKEYLLREFSRNPSGITENWLASLLQRFILCVALSAFFFLFFHYSYYRTSYLIFWIIGLFLYKSLEVFILFKRAFLFSLIIEIAGFILLIAVAFFYPVREFNIDFFVLLFGIITILKLIAGVIYFRHDIFKQTKSTLVYLKQNSLLLSLLYFLPGFIGLLQGKIDLYCTAYFLSSDQVAKYQVFMNLLTIPHIMVTFITLPFIKNVYRLPLRSVKEIINMLSIAGLVVSLPAVIITYFIVENYYHIHLSLFMYIIAYVQLIPFFIYTLRINMLFKYDKQYVVTWITLITGLLGFLLSIILIPYWNIEGAISANTIIQWITLLFFMYSDRYSRTNE